MCSSDLMTIALYLIFAFTIIELITVVLNLVFIQKLKTAPFDEKPLISILIPARNEEENIGSLLTGLINQTYQSIEIIVYDDCSTDHTTQIVTKLALQNSKIKLINGKELPQGWLGKNHACHQLAEAAQGDYFLFLDADVSLKPDLVASTFFHLKQNNLGLLSVFPIQKMKTMGEWITVPLMHFILLSLLPLILVKKSKYAEIERAHV